MKYMSIYQTFLFKFMVVAVGLVLARGLYLLFRRLWVERPLRWRNPGIRETLTCMCGRSASASKTIAHLREAGWAKSYGDRDHKDEDRWHCPECALEKGVVRSKDFEYYAQVRRSSGVPGNTPVSSCKNEPKNEVAS